MWQTKDLEGHGGNQFPSHTNNRGSESHASVCIKHFCKSSSQKNVIIITDTIISKMYFMISAFSNVKCNVAFYDYGYQQS